MKLAKVALALTIGTTLFAACKKDDTQPNNNGGNNTPAKTKKELLTDAKWQTIADIQTISEAGKDTTIDGYALWYEDCSKDDFITFATDGTAAMDEGATKCSPSSPQTETFDWAFVNNDTQLRWTKAGEEDTIMFDIVELTATQLKIKDGYTEDGVTYTQVMTMKNIK